MYKYMPQFELSQNSMFKNIVNFKPSFGYVFQYSVRANFSHWWLTLVVQVGTNGHSAIKYMIPIGTSGHHRLPMATIGDQWLPRLLNEDLRTHS